MKIKVPKKIEKLIIEATQAGIDYGACDEGLNDINFAKLRHAEDALRWAIYDEINT